jgi:acetyl-CoA C-acetyltransferase
VDDRTPVIVGVAHEVHRPGPPEEVVDAITLMRAALWRAGDDAGVPAVLARLDLIAVVQGLWRWPDPGRLLAEHVGAEGARTWLAPACGSTPQVLVAAAAERIASGGADVVAVCGGEWVNGRSQLRALGRKATVTRQHEGQPDEVGEIHAYESEHETALGFTKPLFIYPLMESAIRHHRGESFEENRARIARIVSTMSAVAAINPAAWIREHWSSAEVADVTAANPMVAFPYTKRMVSNPKVDMASAIVLTSVGTARTLGIDPDRWVFPHAAAQLHDRHFFSQFDRYQDSADMKLTTATTLELAGVGVDDVSVLDLYSCFPAAVQLEADGLGLHLGDPRPFTVSGGMASFGGPIANYVGHVLVDMVMELRRQPAELGLCVANGGYLNRPAAGVYGTRPPVHPYLRVDLSDRVAGMAHREVAVGVRVTAVIESATALLTRDAAHRGLATGLLPSGERVLGWTDDADLVERIGTEELVGSTMQVGDDGRIARVVT